MRESTYTASIKKLLPTGVYAWKISDSFTSGIPDNWYSASGGDLWVEWKYYHKMPQTLNLRTGKEPKLTTLQNDWLNARYEEGKNVAVMVGSPAGIAILKNRTWENKIKDPPLVSKRDAAKWIAKQVMPDNTLTETFFHMLKAFKPNAVSLVDDGVNIEGLLINDPMLAIEFINDRYPPKLLPQDPKPRASARLLLYKIFAEYKRKAPHTILKEIGPPSEHFLTGRSVSIIDIALFPLTKGAVGWDDYTDRVTDAIK